MEYEDIKTDIQKIKDSDNVGGYFLYKPVGQTHLPYYLQQNRELQTVFKSGSARSVVPLKAYEETCQKCGEKLETGDRKYYRRNNEEKLNLNQKQYPYCRECMKKHRVANNL